MDCTIESSFANISVLDMSKEELQKEYSNLKKLYSTAQVDIEAKNQQIYDFKRQLATATALEKEYQHEIETLQLEDNNESKKLAATVHNLEEEIKNIKLSNSEHIQMLEDDLIKKNVEIQRLESELKVTVESTDKTDKYNDYEKLNSENMQLKLEISELKEHIFELEQNMELLQKQNFETDEILCQIKNDYKELQENYDIKKEEVIEKNNLLETLQEDIALAKNELDQLKSRPLDQGSRGNSLFAEVDDRRVQLMNEMTFMRTKYKEMKREKTELLKEVTDLRVENTKLVQRWKNEVVEKKQDDQALLKTHNNRIKTLEELIESYQNELKNNPIKYEGANFGGEEAKFVEDMLARKSKEIEQLRQDVSKHSLTHMMLSAQLRDTHAELRSWKATATEYKLEIGMLKDRIEMIKSTDSKVEIQPPPVVEDKKSSLLKPAKPFDITKYLPHQHDSGTTKGENELEEEDMNGNNPDERTNGIGFKTNFKLTMAIPEENEENPENKENLKDIKLALEKPLKKVTFSEESYDTGEPSKVSRRRGTKILTCKTLFVPNKKRDC